MKVSSSVRKRVLEERQLKRDVEAIHKAIDNIRDKIPMNTLYKFGQAYTELVSWLEANDIPIKENIALMEHVSRVSKKIHGS